MTKQPKKKWRYQYAASCHVTKGHRFLRYKVDHAGHEIKGSMREITRRTMIKHLMKSVEPFHHAWAELLKSGGQMTAAWRQSTSERLAREATGALATAKLEDK